MLRLTRRRAREIAVMAQLLDARRPGGLPDTVERLGFLQLDPTAVVARSEQLVLWSRLGGAFARPDLARHVYTERSLFEYRAFIYPRTHYPLIQHAIAGWSARPGPWQARANAWMAANEAFRRYLLAELERRGPLRSRDLEDRAAAPWSSDGWNDGRNVGQMLEFMSARGEVAVAGRDGAQRTWDLAERVLPVDLPPVPEREAREVLQRVRLSALGIARPEVAGEAGVEAEVEGLRGAWRLDPEQLERPFRGRTALLSPFDRLVHDRRRLLELFDFDYRLEIYVPAARRRWGYYVLPALHGDRLVARVDARADRRAGVLRVPALHAEPHARPADLEAVRGELDRLARWLGLDGADLSR